MPGMVKSNEGSIYSILLLRRYVPFWYFGTCKLVPYRVKLDRFVTGNHF